MGCELAVVGVAGGCKMTSLDVAALVQTRVMSSVGPTMPVAVVWGIIWVEIGDFSTFL